MSIMKYPLLSTNVSPNTKRMFLYFFTNFLLIKYASSKHKESIMTLFKINIIDKL